MVPMRTVNLTPLALAFDAPVQRESVYQRLKRFFRRAFFEPDRVAALVARWLD